MTILQADEWERVGRGRTLQFFCTDQEIQQWLIDGLPTDYAPYRLVGYDMVKSDRTYRMVPFECEVDSLQECIRQSEGERSEFFIQSQQLTALPPLSPGANIAAVYSYNGLIRLQHGVLNREGLAPSRIGIVDRVCHIASGEVVDHKEYLSIYNRLRRRIDKERRYATIIRFRDGQELESDRNVRWTEGAVQAYEAGVQFTDRPGRCIK
jgi:hypothetical protein